MNTWLTSGMSSPRAATSLAASNVMRPSRNASSVAMRLIWSMSPCRAPALKPCFCSDLSRIATSRLRLQKMMAFLTFSDRINWRSTSRFSQSSVEGQ